MQHAPYALRAFLQTPSLFLFLPLPPPKKKPPFKHMRISHPPPNDHNTKHTTQAHVVTEKKKEETLSRHSHLPSPQLHLPLSSSSLLGHSSLQQNGGRREKKQKQKRGRSNGKRESQCIEQHRELGGENNEEALGFLGKKNKKSISAGKVTDCSSLKFAPKKIIKSRSVNLRYFFDQSESYKLRERWKKGKEEEEGGGGGGGEEGRKERAKGEYEK